MDIDGSLLDEAKLKQILTYLETERTKQKQCLKISKDKIRRQTREYYAVNTGTHDLVLERKIFEYNRRHQNLRKMDALITRCKAMLYDMITS